MAIKITTLSENTAGAINLLAEWGLSFFIETPSKNILLDTGASLSLEHNLDVLSIDVDKIDQIVLSHGHMDHTGGLLLLLARIQREIEIVAHPDIFKKRCRHLKNSPDRDLSLPYSREELEALGAKFILTPEPYRLSEEIMTTGEVPMVTDFESIEPDLCIKTGSGFEPDIIADDLSLIIKYRQGLVVVLGCAHRGMINILRHVIKITGNNKIHMVIGGCHLMNSSDEQIWQSISALNEIGVKNLALNHCTGMRAMLLMSQTYERNFIFNNTGNIIKLN